MSCIFCRARARDVGVREGLYCAECAQVIRRIVADPAPLWTFPHGDVIQHYRDKNNLDRHDARIAGTPEPQPWYDR